MKIGYVHLSLATESGDPRMFFEIAQGLKRRGHDVNVFTSEFDPKSFPKLNKDLKIQVVAPRAPFASVRGGKGFFGRIFSRYSQLRLHRDAALRIEKVLPRDLDVLICQNDLSYLLLSRYKARRKETRTIWIMNNSPFYYVSKGNPILTLLSAILAWTTRRAVKNNLRGIDSVVVHDVERKKSIDEMGIDSLLLRIPVDFESFKAPVHAYLPGSPITLLSVGSLSPFRRFEDTILAALELRRKKYDVRVILVCKDFWNARAYMEKLLTLARETGMEGWVDFRFQGVGEEELREIQKRSTVYVFPNVVNIWGMAALEAMAAGLPLAVSKVTSVAEILEDGRQAVFTLPGEPLDIASKIEALILDPSRYEAIARAGQEFVKENLTWEKYAEKFDTKAIRS